MNSFSVVLKWKQACNHPDESNYVTPRFCYNCLQWVRHHQLNQNRGVFSSSSGRSHPMFSCLLGRCCFHSLSTPTCVSNIAEGTLTIAFLYSAIFRSRADHCALVAFDSKLACFWIYFLCPPRRCTYSAVKKKEKKVLFINMYPSITIQFLSLSLSLSLSPSLSPSLSHSFI